MGVADGRAVRRVAPGPPGHLLLGNLPEFQRAPLDFLLAATREYGDVVALSMGPRRVHLLRHPDHIQYVLQHNQANYIKRTRLRPFLGDGVATANGARWRHRRRFLQPMFHHVDDFGSIFNGVLAIWVDRWRTLATANRPIELVDEMMRLTLELIGRTLAGADLGRIAEAIRHTSIVLQTNVTTRLLSLLPLPLWVPTPPNLRIRAALAVLDSAVFKLIEQRRRAVEKSDLLAAIMAVRDPETGTQLTDRELRDEVVTLLVAGHENSGNALAWMWYLVATHPSVEQRLHAELDTVLQSRPPTWDDLAALPVARMVVAEALRLYPPGWIVRFAVRADAVGGYHIPARSMVLISPYLTHRHPDFWPEPEVFRPERFAAGMDGLPHRFAYLPFGAGARRCLGMAMAEAEAQLVLATLAQQFRLDVVPGHPVELQPIPTLAPRYGLKVLLKPRADRL